MIWILINILFRITKALKPNTSINSKHASRGSLKNFDTLKSNKLGGLNTSDTSFNTQVDRRMSATGTKFGTKKSAKTNLKFYINKTYKVGKITRILYYSDSELWSKIR